MSEGSRGTARAGTDGAGAVDRVLKRLCTLADCGVGKSDDSYRRLFITISTDWS